MMLMTPAVAVSEASPKLRLGKGSPMAPKYSMTLYFAFSIVWADHHAKADRRHASFGAIKSQHTQSAITVEY
jgi:hypothetical protein